jgi:poly(A) polymerase
MNPPLNALLAALDRDPPDRSVVLAHVSELRAAEGLGQGPYHHLDVLGHTFEVVAGVRHEMARAEDGLGTRVPPERRDGLLLAALLHDVAKPLTRGEVNGRVLFVAHDSLGARLGAWICRRLGAGALETDLVATVTALHLGIGFMGSPRSGYPPERLARAAGPFGEELAALSWADRLGAAGPKLKDEHVERHRALSKQFLEVSRVLGSAGMTPEPDYGALARRLESSVEADVGYAASRIRLLRARGTDWEAALRHVAGLARARSAIPTGL